MLTSLPSVYMRAPETWPFKTPTIPSKLMPSHKTYAPNNEGLVFVDARDIATLLGYGFYLYGQSPDINALLAGLPGAGDPTMFLAMDGVGRTPAGGGGSGGEITSPAAYHDFDLPTSGLLDLNIYNIVVDDSGPLMIAFKVAGAWINDSDSYVGRIVTSYDAGADAKQAVSVDALTKIGGADEYAETPSRAYLSIDPGGAARYPSVQFQSTKLRSPGGPGDNTVSEFFVGFGSVNADATVAPSLGRATQMRLMLYGSGNANDPDGGNITSMIWE